MVTGNRLGLAPAPGTPIQSVAYPSGVNDRPITCATTTYLFARYPAFDCHGYIGGTSGAPLLALASGSVTGGSAASEVVTGIIAGLHQGGCLESTSYSPRFDQDTLTVYRRAARGGVPDSLPVPGNDGC